MRVYRPMLPFVRVGERGPLLVLLHWLGGGAQTWTEVSAGLAERGICCVALDLPGFGEAAGVAGYPVQAKVDAVVETVRALRKGLGESTPWLLAGHSMGGKVAAAVARRSLDGEAGLEGLRGMVLVSPSPAGPEPMRESRREQLAEMFGENKGKDEEAKDAATWVDHNAGVVPFPAAVRERAVAGVVRINRAALRSWFEEGSREDWSERVGALQLPALVLAGTQESSLGPDAQREHTLPHLPQAELVELAGSGHLSPIERPGELVEHITQFVAGLGLRLTVREAEPGVSFRELLGSERTSPATRGVMQQRLEAAQDWNHRPEVFGDAEFRMLRALVERVVPGAGFDVAGALDADMAKSKGDGWRFAALPADLEAWHRGLFSLDRAAERAHGVRFLALWPEQQDQLLEQAREGKLGRGVLGALHLNDDADALPAAEMQLWFEDVRAACARRYMADPRTMERVGYTGFADDLGFTQIELGQREVFEA